MHSGLNGRNAVAAIRVSTTKQGTDGDSSDAQKEQIQRFAELKGITIKEYFIFLESASKELQPMQQVVDYCKDPKHDVDLFIIKSIDRFTRGGSYSYDQMKMQLDKVKVRLVDIYGVISNEQVNTLDHLGFEYKWSVYSPSKKTEMLEAERSKDELRDIMSRMIGAEIRYTQLGYWMRQQPYGFVSEKIETRNGKRCILRPHPTESGFVQRMYELRGRGTMSNQAIVDEINSLGFKTRVRYVRDKVDRTKVVAQTGGAKLTVKGMQKMLRNPIYAGINEEKWTGDKPVRCVFEGLVTIEQFNQAHQGKMGIAESSDGEITIYRKAPPEHLVNKGVRNEEFAYRKFVLCPDCQRPLLGSASRGKSGKHYPAYHCSNHGHYFRVPKAEFEESVVNFISTLVYDQATIDTVMDVISAEWQKRESHKLEAAQALEGRITQLKTEARLAVSKIKLLSSETAIKYLEEDLMSIEKQINNLESQQTASLTEEKPDMDTVLGRVRKLLEHPVEIYHKQIDPIKKAQFFSLLFEQKPTYQDLKAGTQKTPLFTGVHSIFQLAKMEKSLMVTPRRVELLLPG